MSVTARRRAGWALAAVALVGVALAIGIATAPRTSAPSAPAASGLHGIAVPPLAKAASLPALHAEAPAAAGEPEATVTESSGPATAEGETGSPIVTEEPQPTESATEPPPSTEAEAAPEAEGPETIVPEGR
jgi:hypothetical protein